VLAEDEGVDGARLDPERVGEQVPQAGGVEHGPGTDHPLGRQVELLLRDLRQDVHRVGGHQQDALETPLDELADAVADHAGVGFEQVQARRRAAAGFVGRARRDYGDGARAASS
jgi:hypothetical protein